MNHQQISNLLRSQVVERIGCCHKDQVYVVPETYAFNEESIYVHT